MEASWEEKVGEKLGRSWPLARESFARVYLLLLARKLEKTGRGEWGRVGGWRLEEEMNMHKRANEEKPSFRAASHLLRFFN